MKLLVIASPAFGPLPLLASEAPDVEVTLGTTAEPLRAAAREADAILLAPRFGSVITELWREIENVRWIHSLGAGVETLPFDLLRTRDIVLTNSRGIYADAHGEFALAAILWFAKDLRRMFRQQQEHRWEPYTSQRIEGKTVTIIGYGGIGQAIGRRAAAMGMNVLPIRRMQEFGEPTIDEVIPQADYVVLSTPLTPSTVGLMSRERIASMQPHAVFINVGRGRTVDQQALVEALAAKRIRGAALDVFEVEPLPADDPLWTLENVLISPHSADQMPDSHERAMRFFLENLRRFRSGLGVENVVDKVEQY